MTIARHDPTSILSNAVQHGDTVYLAGVVAKNLDQDVKGQTKQELGTPAVQSIVPGAATLVDTAANLLDPERHGGPILRRYADAALREVSERLHAPRRATPAERADWLDRLGRSRRVGASYRALEAEAAEAAAAPTGQADRLTAVAARLHRWKKELLDGS